MNKKTVLWIILDLIFLAIFNTVFFVMTGLQHPASVWISYGFIAKAAVQPYLAFHCIRFLPHIF